MHNPFEQSARTWCIATEMPYQYVALFADYFEAMVDTVSYFEKVTSATVESRPDDIWVLQLFCREEPDLFQLQQEAATLANNMGWPIPSMTKHLVEDQDWVTVVQSQTVPLHVGRFYIHSSAWPVPDCYKRYSITLDAGRAFGTGEHATTSGCLLALEWLIRHSYIGHASYPLLDMGTGTGILAMAMARYTKTPVLAVDIDAQAVHIAKQNVEKNGLHPWIRCLCSQGYHHAMVRRKGPYAVIMANILAKPLILQAKEVAKHTRHRGFVILSGLLTTQERQVLMAYRIRGFNLYKYFRQNGWSALILQKCLT